MKKIHLLLLLPALSLVNSCQDNDEIIKETSQNPEVHSKIINVTRHDGRPFSTGTSPYAKFVAGPGGSVLMQGFYWDVPDGGNWWNTVKGKLTD